METLKKYWWLIFILPVVAYLFYITMKQSNGNPKPGSPEYAREQKAIKAALKKAEETENPDSNGGNNSNSQIDKS